MMILSLLFFLISWIANPGYLYKKPGSTLLKIIEKGNDCTGICPECEIVKPLRSRHCDVCNRCVGVYDHHCPWINNCVGMKNHKYFLAFISSVWIYLLFTILMISINLQYNDISGTYMENWAKIDNKNFLIAKLTCNIASLCVAIFFFVPLSILVYIQIINFFLNKTTAERYGHNTQKNDSRISVQNSLEYNQSLLEISKSESRISNSFKKNKQSLSKKTKFTYLRNCYAMCFGNEYNLTGEQSWLLRS